MTTTPIFVLAGQSNANNESMIAALAANIRDSGGVLVHHAVNGSSLSPYLDVHGNGDWSAADRADDGELLDQLFAKIDDTLTSLEGEGRLAGVIWIQGETDARFDGASREYADRLMDLHQAFLDRFGDHRMAVSALSGEITALRGDETRIVESWDRVREGQFKLSSEVSTLVGLDPDRFGTLRGYETEDMFRSDMRHYTDEFSAELGSALFDLVRHPLDTMPWQGGDGHDRYVYNGKYHLEMQAGDGRDTLIVNRREGETVIELEDSGIGHIRSADGQHMFLANGVERVITYGAADEITMGGTIHEVLTCAGNDLVRGSWRDDSISLGSDDDQGYGEDGEDWVLGGDGLDRLFGGRGDDTLHGQRGDDLLALNDGADRGFGGDGSDTVDGHAGDDEVVGNGGNDLLFGGAGNDRVVGAAGNDRVMGNSGSDTLFGGPGQDILKAGDGRDSIWAGPGDDRVEGGNGTDGLHGGYGDDTLDGGAGDDVLKGAKGADRFIVSAGHDRITDFDPAEDLLIFSQNMQPDWAQQGAHLVAEWSDGEESGSVTLLNTDLDAMQHSWDLM
ncbi:calcium-binding protein [Paracoccus aerodenitrificans]|nr:calcium-binding protein [Paracoccus aerodenitrificans]